jgi:hypothetical protein
MYDHKVAQIRAVNSLRRRGKVFDPKTSTYIRIRRWIHKVLDDDSTEPEVIFQAIHACTSMSELSVRADAEAVKAYGQIGDYTIKCREMDLKERMFAAKRQMVDKLAEMGPDENIETSILSQEDTDLLAELHSLAQSGERMTAEDQAEYGRLMALLAAGQRASEGPGGDGGGAGGAGVS